MKPILACVVCVALAGCAYLEHAEEALRPAGLQIDAVPGAENEDCACSDPDGPATLEVAAHDDDGAELWRAEVADDAEAFGLIGAELLEGGVAVAGQRAIRLFDLDGTLVESIHDAPSPVGYPFAMIIHDTVRLEVGAVECATELTDNGRLLAACGDRLVYFSGRTLMVFDDALQLVGDVVFDANEHEHPSETTDVELRLEAADVTLRIFADIYC